MPVLSNDLCVKDTNYTDKMITANMLCAGYPGVGKKDSCQVIYSKFELIFGLKLFAIELIVLQLPVLVYHAKHIFSMSPVKHVLQLEFGLVSLRDVCV